MAAAPFPAHTSQTIIDIAADVVILRNGNDSAKLCLADARTLQAAGKRFDYAAGRALAAIKHTLGVFSAEYDMAAQLFEDARKVPTC